MKDDRLVEMRVLRAVVEAGGFTAAAHVLGASQPFVSQTVRQLEARLGVTLLQRSTRGHRLTPEGERYLAAATRLLAELDEAEQAVAGAARAPAGPLRISAPVAFGNDQLVPRLPDFLARHPRIELALALTDRYVSLVEDRIDVAVRMGRLRDSSLASRRLCDLQRIVVAAPSYVAAHGRPAHPRELARHPALLWQGPQEHLNRWPFVVDGELVEIVARGPLRSSDGQALFQLCVAGLGIMRLAEHLALPAIRAGRLVPLLEPYLARDEAGIHAVFLPEMQQQPRVRAFVDFVVEAYAAPPWLPAE